MMGFSQCFFLGACDWLQSLGDYPWSPAHEYLDVKLPVYAFASLSAYPLKCLYIPSFYEC